MGRHLWQEGDDADNHFSDEEDGNDSDCYPWTGLFNMPFYNFVCFLINAIYSVLFTNTLCLCTNMCLRKYLKTAMFIYVENKDPL
jgi:hypothetical protein